LALLVGLLSGRAVFGQDKDQPKPAKPSSGLAEAFGSSCGMLSGDPDAARLITTDIPNFWQAYDKATPQNLAEILERDYLQRGSPGLKDFQRLRIRDAETLAKAINAYPKYYASIRESTLRVASMEKRIRAPFYALKHLYPEAVFPDVYFLIGRL